MSISDKIELMAPAGSMESLYAAIKAGANSVYFGIDKLNMRARSAKPFTLDNLHEIATICSQHDVKSYLALNTIIYDDEIAQLHEVCAAAKKAKISAVIAADLAAIQVAREHGLEIHMSTQANISNFEAVKFFAQFSNVVVLARELTLPQIKYINEQIISENITGPNGKPVEIELFVHGALCVSISGKCYMSLAQTNHSANRGDCLQTCRRRYHVTDDQTGEELVIDNKYVMSPKDLCTIRFIDKLVDSGATVFKIEGRGRSADYVFKVTKAYKNAISHHLKGTLTQEVLDTLEKELESVFNRGFWHGGYYLGNKMGEWTGSYGSRATKQKKYVGYVKNYFGKAQIAQIIVEDNSIKVGDEIIATGPTTGHAESQINSIFKKEKPVDFADKGSDVTIPFADKIRRKDKIYVYRERNKILSP